MPQTSIAADSIPLNDTIGLFLHYDSLNRLPYDWFACRLRLEITDHGATQQLSASLRMRRDSIIWLSLQGPLGIEVARVRIDRDSFRIFTIQSEYMIRPLSYLQRLLPLRPELRILQDFLMGFRLIDDPHLQYMGMQDSLHLLRIDRPEFRYSIWAYPQNYTLARSLLTDKMVIQEMRLTFDSYTVVQGHPLATDRTIIIQQQGRAVDIHMELSKIRVNEPLSFPWDIDPAMHRVDEIRF